MKTKTKLLTLSFVASMIFGAAAFFGANSLRLAKADSINPYPRTGQSGTIMFVNGQGHYFNTGEADLAICCRDSSSNYAWSERVSYRVEPDILRVMIPYLNGNSHTWSQFKICRYNPSMNPQTDGDSGVYNETEFISFSSFCFISSLFQLLLPVDPAIGAVVDLQHVGLRGIRVAVQQRDHGVGRIGGKRIAHGIGGSLDGNRKQGHDGGHTDRRDGHRHRDFNQTE